MNISLSTIENLARILLDSDTAVSTGKLKVCSTQPVQVCRNVTFLVDLNALDDPMDVRADKNGAWERKVPLLLTSACTKMEELPVCINGISWDVTQIIRSQGHIIGIHHLQTSQGS